MKKNSTSLTSIKSMAAFDGFEMFELDVLMGPTFPVGFLAVGDGTYSEKLTRWACVVNGVSSTCQDKTSTTDHIGKTGATLIDVQCTILYE